MEKRNLKNYNMLGLIITALALSFYSVFQKLMIRWDTGDNSYCYLIIPLFIYLCWEKRRIFHFGQYTWNLWGTIPVIVSLLMILIGELGSVETLLYLGIWGCIVSVIIILYGFRLRLLLFPLLILMFIVPVPPFVKRILTFNLKLAASGLSVLMLQLAGVSVLQEGNIIDLGITRMQVVDACSGLRYFMPLIVMSLLFGHFYCCRLWQKAVLLALVLPLSVIVNGMRIFATGMLYVWDRPELAKDFFHDFSGWVVFMVAAAILFGVSMVLRRFAPTGLVERVKEARGKAVGPMVPMALTIALCLLFASTGWTLHKLPSATHLPSRKSFDAFPMIIGKWRAKRHYLSKDILNYLWADDYINATYTRRGLPNSIQVLIPFYAYQSTRHTAHTPQSCMLGSGWALADSQKIMVDVGDGDQIPLSMSLWKKGDYQVCGAYFFLMRGRVITSPWANKFYLIMDAVTKRRTDGALVRMEMAVAQGQSVKEVQAIIEAFVVELWPILPAYVPQ